MSSSDNDSDNSYSSNETNESSTVVQNCPTKPTCSILAKGGGVDDYGMEFKIPFDCCFDRIYVGYARVIGVPPSDIKFTYRGRYVSPESTPFEQRMWGREVILAYGKDNVTPMPINEKPFDGPQRETVFVIQEMTNNPVIERHKKNNNFEVQELYKEWAAARGIRWEKVTLYLDRNPLNVFALTKGTTIYEAGFYDGALLYGRWDD